MALLYIKKIRKVALALIIIGCFFICISILKETKQTIKKETYTINKDQEKNNPNKIKEDIKIKTEKTNQNNYIGVINIPKIKLKKYLYDIESPLNDVNKNIEILKTSSLPNIEGGNFILAAHSGNTAVGYFKHLDELNLKDKIEINYKGQDYIYEISKKYEVLKTGKVSIFRDKSKNAITLITCKSFDKQIVIIGYLKNT